MATIKKMAYADVHSSYHTKLSAVYYILAQDNCDVPQSSVRALPQRNLPYTTNCSQGHGCGGDEDSEQHVQHAWNPSRLLEQTGS